MKVAIFNHVRKYGRAEYSFDSLIELEENNIQSLLVDNSSLLIGTKLYIKVPEETNQISGIYEVRDLSEGDNVIILDENNILNSMVANVAPIDRGVYKLEGIPLFNPDLVLSTEGFKKIYGKDFSIFKVF